jgi:hypothetical protein
VESDSGTDTSDDSVKVVGDETVVLDDSNVDPELQFAIELSLQEQRHTKGQELRVKDTELYKKTENVDAVSTKNKNSNRSGIPVVTAGRQTRPKSAEKRQQGIIEAEKSTKHQNKQTKVESLIASSVADSDDIKEEGRRCSSESNGRGFHDSKNENKVNGSNNGKSDEQSNNGTYTSRRVVTIEKKSGILKRNISCLSNESNGSSEEPNKVRKIDLSDVDTDKDADVSESSESDGMLD